MDDIQGVLIALPLPGNEDRRRIYMYNCEQALRNLENVCPDFRLRMTALNQAHLHGHMIDHVDFADNVNHQVRLIEKHGDAYLHRIRARRAQQKVSLRFN